MRRQPLGSSSHWGNDNRMAEGQPGAMYWDGITDHHSLGGWCQMAGRCCKGITWYFAQETVKMFISLEGE